MDVENEAHASLLDPEQLAKARVYAVLFFSLRQGEEGPA
jgi:hypothetical protein